MFVIRWGESCLHQNGLKVCEQANEVVKVFKFKLLEMGQIKGASFAEGLLFNNVRVKELNEYIYQI